MAIYHSMMSYPFQGEGDPLRTQGEGTYQSVTCTKGWGSQGKGGPWWVTLSKKGWGTVLSHPFQEGVWGRDESPEGGGQGKRRAPPITAKTKCVPYYYGAM